MAQSLQNPQPEPALITTAAVPSPDLPIGAVGHIGDQTLTPDSAEETEAREASALWDQPDAWPGLDATRLKRLALFGCLRYGRSGSERDMRQVGQVYELVTDELPVADRQDLLVEVNEAVENGVASVNAFLPFLMTDPDIRVVSTAALNLASLMPLKDGDPLTGPKYLLSDVVALPNPEIVRAGALVGLLLLGDRRVTRLLVRCWQSLTDEGRCTSRTRTRGGRTPAPWSSFSTGSRTPKLAATRRSSAWWPRRSPTPAPGRVVRWCWTWNAPFRSTLQVVSYRSERSPSGVSRRSANRFPGAWPSSTFANRGPRSWTPSWRCGVLRCQNRRWILTPRPRRCAPRTVRARFRSQS